jgi:hypothetical protein
MQMRRFNGTQDWPAQAAVVDLNGAAMRARPATALRRGALVLLGMLVALTLALAFTTQARASVRPTCGGELASWSDSPAELASWTSAPQLFAAHPKGDCDAALTRVKKHKQTKVSRSK